MAIAYVVIPGNKTGERIGLVKFGESGYYQTFYDNAEDIAHCHIAVRLLNDQIGVTQDIEESMLAGSMFGWSCPAARRARLFAAAQSGGI